MAKLMKFMALLTTLMTVALIVSYKYTDNHMIFVFMISFGTTAYHLDMRLMVGAVIDRLLDNHVNYRKRWFQVSAAEQKLYKKLKVKKWKTKMMTYDPNSFDRKLHSWDEIAQAMCQAELVHEVIILLSFVPIAASIPFGEVWIFAITSVLAACFDAAFVIMQRYNRPRIIKLIKKTEKNIQIS